MHSRPYFVDWALEHLLYCIVLRWPSDGYGCTSPTWTRVCGMHTLSSLFLFASHTAPTLKKEWLGE